MPLDACQFLLVGLLSVEGLDVLNFLFYLLLFLQIPELLHLALAFEFLEVLVLLGGDFVFVWVAYVLH